MSRSLSPLESKLILYLEWEKQPIVTIEDAARVLNISKDYARKVLQRLTRNKWLAPITPGKYELIPAERGEYAFPDTNPLFIGSHLVTPYYFSYATAGYYHGLTTQASHSRLYCYKRRENAPNASSGETFPNHPATRTPFFWFRRVKCVSAAKL